MSLVFRRPIDDLKTIANIPKDAATKSISKTNVCSSKFTKMLEELVISHGNDGIDYVRNILTELKAYDENKINAEINSDIQSTDFINNITYKCSNNTFENYNPIGIAEQRDKRKKKSETLLADKLKMLEFLHSSGMIDYNASQNKRYPVDISHPAKLNKVMNQGNQGNCPPISYPLFISLISGHNTGTGFDNYANLGTNYKNFTNMLGINESKSSNSYTYCIYVVNTPDPNQVEKYLTDCFFENKEIPGQFIQLFKDTAEILNYDISTYRFVRVNEIQVNPVETSQQTDSGNYMGTMTWGNPQFVPDILSQYIYYVCIYGPQLAEAHTISKYIFDEDISQFVIQCFPDEKKLPIWMKSDTGYAMTYLEQIGIWQNQSKAYAPVSATLNPDNYESLRVIIALMKNELTKNTDHHNSLELYITKFEKLTPENENKFRTWFSENYDQTVHSAKCILLNIRFNKRINNSTYGFIQHNDNYYNSISTFLSQHEMNENETFQNVYEKYLPSKYFEYMKESNDSNQFKIQYNRITEINKSIQAIHTNLTISTSSTGDGISETDWKYVYPQNLLRKINFANSEHFFYFHCFVKNNPEKCREIAEYAQFLN